MTTKVIFRVDYNGHPIAFFPEMAGNMNPTTMLCYQHVGQHSIAHVDYIRIWTFPAKPEEYQELLKELESIGYDDLRIVKRMTRGDLEKRREQVRG